VSPPRYFFAQDSSSHWYLVDADRRAEWDAWADLPEEDENAWEPPDFAQRLDGHPSQITFTEPEPRP